MSLPPPYLVLRCPDGFKYTGTNVVEAHLHQGNLRLNLAPAVVAFFNGTSSRVYEGE